MKILLIILLHYLAITNGLSLYNSNAFNSGAFNSGAFNSNAFNSNAFNSGAFNSGAFNSGTFNSNAFNSGAFNSNAFNSVAFNSYAFNSYARSAAIKHCNSFYLISSPKPSPSPSPKNIGSSYSNNRPTYLSYVGSNVLIISSYNSLYLISSAKPSPRPSPMPSPRPSPTLIPIISFNTKIAFSKFSTTELEIDRQNVLIIATADAMNISTSFVKYIGTIVLKRRRLINKYLQLIVSLQTNILLQGQYAGFQSNPSALYFSLTNNLYNYVDSGAFVKALYPSFENYTVLSVKNGKYVLIKPPEYKSAGSKSGDLSILYVVLFLLGILVLVKIGYDVQTKKKWYNKSLFILQNAYTKIKKRRYQKHSFIDNLKYLYERNNPSVTQTGERDQEELFNSITNWDDCDPEELFCSISDWNEYDESLNISESQKS